MDPTEQSFLRAPQPSQQHGNLDVEQIAQNPHQLTIKAKEVARKIQSVDHFIYIWGGKGGFFLPPKKFITWRFVAQLLSNEKRLVKSKDVATPVALPKVKGLYVEELFWRYYEENDLHRYFPDLGNGHRIPRDYFFNVG